MARLNDNDVKHSSLPLYGWGKSLDLTGKGHPIAKRVWKTYKELESYVLDPNDSAVAGILLTVTNDGENNGAYLVKSIDYSTQSQAKAEIVKLSTGECKIALSETVSPEIAYVTDNGKLHIEDMRTYWGEKSFQD